MTNQEIFYKGIDKLGLTDKQKLDVKILALEYAHQEYTKAAKLGHDRLMGYLEIAICIVIVVVQKHLI